MTNRHFKPVRQRLERLARKLGLLASADDRDSDLVVYIKCQSGHSRLLRAA